MPRNLWTREELILAFNLYLKIEFGKTHKGNSEVIKLANLIGRTPSSIGMRLEISQASTLIIKVEASED
jgi:putative restriction endonuclease